MATILAFMMHSLTHKHSKLLIALLLVILFVPSFTKGSEIIGDEVINFTLVSSDIPRSSGIDTSIIYRRTLEEIATREVYPDVIVLPEGNGIVKMTDDSKEMLQELFGENNILVISSEYVDDENGDKYSRLSYDSSEQGNIENYEKIFLMPQGEYTPRIISLVFPLLQNEYVNRYIKNLSLKKGSETKSVEYKGVKIGGLLCSESMSPRLYRKMVKEQGVNVLVNLARTSWFHNSKMLHNKTVEIAKVHAVQNRAYYLQATNGSPSFIINSNGELIAETKWNKTAILDVEIPK